MARPELRHDHGQRHRQLRQRGGTDDAAITVNGLPAITAPAAATVAQNLATAISGVSVSETGNTTTSGETFTAVLATAPGCWRRTPAPPAAAARSRRRTAARH